MLQKNRALAMMLKALPGLEIATDTVAFAT